jgi:hypothetical protein
MATLKLLNATAMSGPTTTTNFTIVGEGTQGSPYSGNSTNSGLHNTTANATFSIVGASTGTLQYDVNISSEQNYDFGRIRKNGNIELQVSGAGNHTGSFSVSAGDNVQVQYFKDGSVNSGLDVFTVNSLFITGSPTVRFLGAATSRFLDQTVTPTLSVPSIGGLTCTVFIGFSDTTTVDFTVSVNNTGVNDITVRASLNSNFSGSNTLVRNGGGTAYFQLVHNETGSIPGTVTVYVRLEKSGYNNSSVVTKTQTLSFCDSM